MTLINNGYSSHLKEMDDLPPTFSIAYGRIVEETFPDGTKNINAFWAKSDDGRTSPLKDLAGAYKELTFRWRTDSDLITLMLLKKHYPDLRHLRVLYMPYGRDDRDAVGGSKCSLRYAGEFIQSLGFEKIVVLDPHSDVSLAYLGENAVSYYPYDLLKEAVGIKQDEQYVVMFPDAGAAKRYGKIWKEFQQIVGNKARDFTTGEIIGYSLSNVYLAENAFVLIVDDLCSYGGTFIAAANALLPFKPRWIYLIVTHCENSIFKGKLLDQDSHIDRIITTDSLITERMTYDAPMTIVKL